MDEREKLSPTWDRLTAELRALVHQDYGECAYAALVVHIADGKPDLQIPFFSRSSGVGSGPSRSPATPTQSP